MAKGYSARKGFSGGAGMMQQQAQMQQKLMKMQQEMNKAQEEVENSSFTASVGGGAVTADTPRLLADTAMALLADPERLRAMSDALRSTDAQTPAEQIYDCLRRPKMRLDTAQRYA